MNQKIDIPLALWKELQILIEEGWATNVQQVLLEALRRYLDTHQAQLSEGFIQEDVRWGLYGKD